MVRAGGAAQSDPLAHRKDARSPNKSSSVERGEQAPDLLCELHRAGASSRVSYRRTHAI
jgi:hypothetical protein